jgi:hypothetical protein
MTLRITAKVKTRIHLPQFDPEPEGSAFPFLHQWYVNHTEIGRRSYFVFTETLTLYTMVLPSKGVSSRKQLERLGTDVVFSFLKREYISQALFEELASEVTLLKTADRRIVGSQNDLIGMAQAETAYLGEGADFSRINRTPMAYLREDHSPDRAVLRHLGDLRHKGA